MRSPLFRFALTGLFAVAVVCAAALAGATGLRAESAGDIRRAIEGQLAVFQRDDGRAAFSYASPSIRQKFGSPEIFMRMVRGGYPQVYRPRAVEFQALKLDGGRAVQRVFFVGADGGGVLARYLMERQPDGSWKIDGVRIERRPDATA